MFLDYNFLRICLTLLYINLIKIKNHLYYLIFFFFCLCVFPGVSHFSHFVMGRTHPQFWGCKEWFWGSKMSIDNKMFGGPGLEISKEISNKGDKIPL